MRYLKNAKARNKPLSLWCTHHQLCFTRRAGLHMNLSRWIKQGRWFARQTTNLREGGGTEQPGETPPKSTLLCHPPTLKWTFIIENLEVQWVQEGFQVQGGCPKNWKVFQVTDGASLGMEQHNTGDKRKLWGPLLRQLVWGSVEGGQRTYRECLGIVSITRQWWIKREILMRITKKPFCWSSQGLHTGQPCHSVRMEALVLPTRSMAIDIQRQLENSALAPSNVKYGKTIWLSNYYNQKN